MTPDFGSRAMKEKEYGALSTVGKDGLRDLLAAILDAAAVWSLPSGKCVEVNDEFERLSGYSRDRLIGKTPAEVGFSIDPEDVPASSESSLPNRETRFHLADGREVFGLVSTRIIEISGERYALSLIRDTSDRKRLEDSLRRSDAEHRKLVEALGAIVWRGDPQTFQFRFVSKEAERMLGYPVERWVDEPRFWADHIHPDDREWAISFCGQATRENRSHEFEYRMIAADGRIVWLRDVVQVVLENDEPRELVGAMFDITERIHAEEALRRSEQELRHLAEHSADIISRHDPDGVIRYVSPACREVLGYEPEELIGKRCLDLLHPDDVEPTDRVIFASLGSRQSQFVTSRVRRRDGSYAWIETAVRGVRDEKTGAPVELVTVGRDVTERQKTERLRQDVVAMLSHDMKNPLSVVLGFAEILQTEALDANALREIADVIESNARRAMALVVNFLDAERIEAGALTLQPKISSLNDIVERVLRQHEGRARRRKLQVETRLAPDLPGLPVDETLIDRAIANLVGNAMTFSPAGGVVLIETAVQADRVDLVVRDQGPGVPTDERQYLFQRYSSIATKRQSTGLGLYIVKTIVEAHRGKVSAEFPPHGGSAFTISLPTAPPPR